MKRLAVFLGLALVAGAWLGPASAQDSFYPGDANIARAEAKAKAAAPGCLSELKGKRSGPACTRYHAAALDAMGQQNRRLEWCNVRMSEATAFKMVSSCLQGGFGQNLEIERVEAVERTAAPKAWKKFDDDMAKFGR